MLTKGDEAMNSEDIEKEIAEQLEIVITRWCPETFKHEPFKSRMIRALLQLNAYMLDYDRVKRGEQPIGPSFPIELPDFKKNESHEQVRARLIEYLKSPDTKKLIDSLVSQVFKIEHPGVKYSHDFDIESLKLTIQTDHSDPDSIRSEFIKKVPGGVLVEVNKL